MASKLTPVLGAAILVSVMTSLHAVPAGIKVTMTQEFLQAGARTDVRHVVKSVKKLHIPDMVNSSGSFHWQVTGVHVANVGQVMTSVQLGDGVMHFSADVTKFVISASWAFDSKDQAGVTLQGNGKMNVSSAKTSINITGELAAIDDGKIAIDVIDCRTDITQLKIKFYDSELVSFMEMIADSIVSDLKKEIKTAACKPVSAFSNKMAQDINKLQEKTSNLTVYNQTFAVNSSIVAVNVTTKAIYVYLRGDFTLNGRKYPISDQHFSMATSASGVDVSLAKALFGNVVKAVNDSGLLQYKLGFKEIMTRKLFALNFTCSGIVCAGNVFYKAAERWPGRVIGIRGTVTSLLLSVGDNFMYLYVDGRVYFSAEGATSSDPWFSAALNLVIPMQLRHENGRMHGKVSKIGGNITVDQSDYWQTLNEPLPNLLKYYGPEMENKVLDLLRDHDLSFRLPLPKGVNIKSSKISINPEGVSVSYEICGKTEEGCSGTADTGYVGNATVGSLNFRDTLPIPTTTPITTKSINSGVRPTATIGVLLAVWGQMYF